MWIEGPCYGPYEIDDGDGMTIEIGT